MPLKTNTLYINLNQYPSIAQTRRGLIVFQVPLMPPESFFDPVALERFKDEVGSTWVNYVLLGFLIDWMRSEQSWVTSLTSTLWCPVSWHLSWSLTRSLSCVLYLFVLNQWVKKLWDFVIAGSKECSGTQGYLFFQIAFFNQMLY